MAVGAMKDVDEAGTQVHGGELVHESEGGKINQGKESWLKIQSSQQSKQTTPGRNPEEVDHSQQHASGYSPKP